MRIAAQHKTSMWLSHLARSQFVQKKQETLQGTTMEAPGHNRPVSVSSNASSLSFECSSALAVPTTTAHSIDAGSMMSSSSSSSSRDSHSSFGSSVTLASSASASQHADSGCYCSDREGDGSRTDLPTLHDHPAGTPCDFNAVGNGSSGGQDQRESQRPDLIYAPIATEAMASDPKLSYLDRVVLEVLQTERMYVRDLRSIVEDYVGCIIDSPELPLEPEEVSIIFGNVEDIYALHSELVQELESCLCCPVAIAECFVNKNEAFHIYTEYCMNYPNSMALLNECLQNEVLERFFQKTQASLHHALPLSAYLLKPVQRILKYHLLLQEIENHYDGPDEAFQLIEKATNTMMHVAQHINDIKRKHEYAQRVLEIQIQLNDWEGPPLERYGELVLEGSFHVHRAKHERTLFLFHKILLLVKRRDDGYFYKGHILCSNLMLVEHVPKEPLSFIVRHFKNSKVQHTIQARVLEEKRFWITELKRLIIENHPGTIPLKAKQSLLAMNALYGSAMIPNRGMSSRNTLDSTRSFSRKGRRRSEPLTRKFRTMERAVEETA
uniref:pleckstrin homology domain-containing family G member 1-like n=1 Tax=Myxine glutinosa TaxID=7769 RepID=UPI00358FC81D